MSGANSRRMTLAEFLSWEAEQPDRHEFVDGEAFAMPHEDMDHGRVARNITAALHRHLMNSPCETLNHAQKLHVGGDVFYPDVLVTCSESDLERKLVVTEPTLLVEVLSPSTAARDLGVKLDRYLTIPTLKEYVMIDPTRQGKSMVYRKSEDDRIEFVMADPADGIAFELVGLRLDAQTLFDGIKP